MAREQITCPGCRLSLPRTGRGADPGYYHASPECFSVYTEVLGSEFGNVVLYGQVHQLTVDAYAVQHAGGSHPDKSVTVHLVGLHLTLEHGIRSPEVPALLQRLAGAVKSWPHFPPPRGRGSLTVRDVALADSPDDHIQASRAWAREVWSGYSAHHATIADLVTTHLGLP